MGLLNNLMKNPALEKIKLIAFFCITIGLIVTFGLMYYQIKDLKADNAVLELSRKALAAQNAAMLADNVAARAITRGEAERVQERSKRKTQIRNEIEAENETDVISDSWRRTLDRLYDDETSTARPQNSTP